MADIKQAAQCILKGRDVRRKDGRYWLSPDEPFRFTYTAVCVDGGEHQLDAHDLLAEDWELCEYLK